MRYRVVLVPFPFDDLSGQKVRPAVCLTDAVGTHRHVVLAFISSTVPTTLEPTDILLTPGTPDFAATGLRMHSTLRLHRMVTVSTAIIRRQMGRLTPGVQAQVLQRLRTLFAL
jgi:mRNA interferase MazF